MVNGESARELMLTILRVQTTFRQVIQKSLKEHNIDLTFEMLQILVYLWKQDGVNQQELAIKNFKDKASLTSLLNNLETKNLVIRVEDPNDRRNKKIYLTDSGKQYSIRVRPVINGIYEKAEKEIDKTKTEAFINYLLELDNVFKKQ